MASHHQAKDMTGYRFNPTNKELLKYLLGFAINKPLPQQYQFMQLVNLYADKEPWEVFDSTNNDTPRYFITQHNKEKEQHVRVKRTVGINGTWKLQGKVNEVFDDKGKLMGSVVFHVESIARVRRLSLSGLLLYKLHIVYKLNVQWPQLKEKYQGTSKLYSLYMFLSRQKHIQIDLPFYFSRQRIEAIGGYLIGVLRVAKLRKVLLVRSIKVAGQGSYQDSTRGGSRVRSHPTRPRARSQTGAQLGVGNGGQPQVVASKQVRDQVDQEAPTVVLGNIPTVALPADAMVRLLNVLEALVPNQGAHVCAQSTRIAPQGARGQSRQGAQGAQIAGGPPRFFDMTRHDIEASNTVVIGIITVNSHKAYSLIDPGSTYSYMSPSFSLFLERKIKTY
ncbi:putative NAC domain-containing protein 8-like [Capsicum annuum]|nr:putative NAC domain-containing protein 8-like [Capsicum annuum]